MQYSYYYKNDIKQVEGCNRLTTSYDNYKKSPSSSQKIPKIIHQIWLGGDVPPGEQQRCSNIEKGLPSRWVIKYGEIQMLRN